MEETVAVRGGGDDSGVARGVGRMSVPAHHCVETGRIEISHVAIILNSLFNIVGISIWILKVV